MHARTLAFLAAATTPLALGGARYVSPPVRAERIAPNDNVHRAGTLANGALTVAIEARDGEWQPELQGGHTYQVAAFAIAGGPLQLPGPLLRAPVGTEIRVAMHNALATPMWIYGLGEHRGLGDSTLLAPNATHEFRFRATAPGLFYYAGRTTNDPVTGRNTSDSQLNGVIAIDPRGAVPNDRIFIISGWDTVDSTTMSGLGPYPILAFNGLGWPNTPRVDISQGDTLHWRFVNTTDLSHPLHLHGAYFRVDARGDARVDTIYAPEDRRMAVTELVDPGQTMSMTWTPVHSGNWLFHCHFASHVTRSEMFDSDRRMPMRDSTSPPMSHDDAHYQHMGGLVIGIHVHPRGTQETIAPVSQELRLLVRSRAKVYGDYVGYGYVLGDSPVAAMRDSFTVPGPTLELTRGKRVAITIVNQAHEPVAIHWHGLEIESYPDGVPGWSGIDTTTIHHVMPGDSLTVRFTPTRAGTFMYHSHSNEMQEIASGLYGAIIVRDPGEVSGAERTLLFSDDGPSVRLTDNGPPALLNGKLVADTIDVPLGKPTRLRLINIRTENSTALALEQNGALVMWREIAKDGASLPTHQSRERAATQIIGAGEIYDMEIAPAKAGNMILRYEAIPGDTTTTRRAVIRAH